MVVEQILAGEEECGSLGATVAATDDRFEAGPHDVVLAVVVVLDHRLEAIEPAGERGDVECRHVGRQRACIDRGIEGGDEPTRITTHGIVHRREHAGVGGKGRAAERGFGDGHGCSFCVISVIVVLFVVCSIG